MNNPTLPSISVTLPALLGAFTLPVLGFAGPDAPGAAEAESARPPNIVFVFADDIGISAISGYGSDDYMTPQIDALASAMGMKFNYCFSAPICGPARAQIMTGRYGFRTGAIGNGSTPRVSPYNETTMPRLLREAGYKTLAVGKWPQLAAPKNNEEMLQWGFDESLIWVGAGADGDERYWGPDFMENGVRKSWPDDVFGPDVMQEFVLDFIRRNKDQPFYIYYSTPLPHSPRVRTPDSVPGTISRDQMYKDKILYLDKQVGDLAKALHRMELMEQTLLLFTGDNGSLRGERIGGRVIHGGKGDILDGGVRVPLVAVWPGTVPAGTVNNDLIDFSDMLPTFLDIAGTGTPQDLAIDGRSFFDQLRGKPGNPRQWVYYQNARPGNNQYAVRNHDWKLDHLGGFYSMADAPWSEIPADMQDPKAVEGYRFLRAVMDELNPSGGFTPPQGRTQSRRR